MNGWVGAMLKLSFAEVGVMAVNYWYVGEEKKLIIVALFLDEGYLLLNKGFCAS